MKSPGEKSNTPPFFTILGPDFVARKYPFTGDFGNTHAVPPTPEWGWGGGAGFFQGTIYDIYVGVTYIPISVLHDGYILKMKNLPGSLPYSSRKL